MVHFEQWIPHGHRSLRYTAIGVLDIRHDQQFLSRAFNSLAVVLSFLIVEEPVLSLHDCRYGRQAAACQNEISSCIYRGFTILGILHQSSLAG